MKTKLKAVPRAATNDDNADERATNVAGIRALEMPDVGRPMVDQLEHEIAMIDVLLLLLVGDVGELAVLAKQHPYIAEIDHRLANMRDYIALERMNQLPRAARGAK